MTNADETYVLPHAVDGLNVTRMVARDRYQPSRVLAVSNLVNGILIDAWDFEHDACGRITSRNVDTFGYNDRSELTGATIGENTYQYSFDSVGNSIWTSCNAATNTYTANNLNQYSSVLCDLAPSREMSYDADGNLTNDGVLAYTYDCENRLVSVSSNDTLLASYAYDYQRRRVRKTTPNAEHRYFYDDWNLVHETVIAGAVTNQIDYYWGRDLSGTLQGAGGVGGLLAVCIDGAFYFPLYDHNGNITDYVSSTGTVVAHYEYDAFGNIVNQSGVMVDLFSSRFSTKYFDPETGFYYYGYRYYIPTLRRWLTPDPIEEEGGLNLYGFCGNMPLGAYDNLGLYTLADAKSALKKDGVAKEEIGKFFDSYSDEQIFDKWLELERSRGTWWTSLPRCPRKICIDKNGKPKNLTNTSQWESPSSFSSRYHPGAVYEMRSRPLSNGCGNQCTYDAKGNLLTTIPAAGTADSYSPDWYSDVLNLVGHYFEDVQTYELSEKLRRINDYYSVRPIW